MNQNQKEIEFQSTPSARRATHSERHGTGLQAISIHALREEGDPPNLPRSVPAQHFNPRPPRGGRPAIAAACKTTDEFQSTPSARRATRTHTTKAKRRYISIHALREEGDHEHLSGRLCNQNFNPRPPRGGRQSSEKKQRQRVRFQSTPSARRATIGFLYAFLRRFRFQSTPSARRATCCPLHCAR